jgi:lactoylglutathione lyase
VSEGRITGVFHTGITVSDLQRSIDHYCGLLGLELLWRRLYEEPYVLDQVNVDGATALDCAWVRVPGSDHIIELIEYHGGEPRDGSARPCDYGSAHFGVVVDDIHTMAEKLRAAGVRFRTRGDGPVAIKAGANKGGWALYTYDPDGFVVELHQRAPAAA